MRQLRWPFKSCTLNISEVEGDSVVVVSWLNFWKGPSELINSMLMDLKSLISLERAISLQIG